MKDRKRFLLRQVLAETQQPTDSRSSDVVKKVSALADSYAKLNERLNNLAEKCLKNEDRYLASALKEMCKEYNNAHYALTTLPERIKTFDESVLTEAPILLTRKYLNAKGIKQVVIAAMVETSPTRKDKNTAYLELHTGYASQKLTMPIGEYKTHKEAAQAAMDAIKSLKLK